MSEETGRLPAGTRLGPVRLQISNLERSRAYYEEVLGLRVLAGANGPELDPSGAVLRLGAPGAVESLVELIERPGAAVVPPRGRLGLYHFALLLPDRAALGRFLLHLADMGLSWGAADHRVSEAVYLQDPDNLGIEVYADRPRGAWRYRNGELVLGSDPLDVESVVHAAHGERWTGAPEGTAMGHVHLHVADLKQADAFYHTALGFDETMWSYWGALFLSAGGYHHHLGLNTWAPTLATRPEDARLLEWHVVLPDQDGVAQAFARLEAAGEHPVWTGAGWTAADPWGTTVRVRATG